jgi:uncharacterized protein (DUF2235 family)
MSKNIVICLDGTWNDKDEDGGSPTNVVLLFAMCLNDGVSQVAYYDKGVGTEGWYDRKLGGVHGWGLSKNIREAYGYLSKEYDTGDRVYLFGFSRGAYTARSLAGLIFRCGLPHKDHEQSDIDNIFRLYRDRNDQRMGQAKEGNLTCPIEMVGVWDTVGSLGIPVSILKDVSEEVFAFHDTRMSPEIQYACHAVAIDERRESFEPSLWNEMPATKDRVKQVWFAGVHSDVGGGYPERHHSDIALRWMVKHAHERGLKLTNTSQQHFAIDFGRDIHKSVYEVMGVEVGTEDRDASTTDGPMPVVHWSVREKMTRNTGYRPVALAKHITDWSTLAPYEVDEFDLNNA